MLFVGPGLRGLRVGWLVVTLFLFGLCECRTGAGGGWEMIEPRTLKGFRDFLPAVMQQRERLRRLIARCTISRTLAVERLGCVLI